MSVLFIPAPFKTNTKLPQLYKTGYKTIQNSQITCLEFNVYNQKKRKKYKIIFYFINIILPMIP